MLGLCYDLSDMRALILSDIHANLVALETVLNHAEGKYDAIWCLGDIVGYGPRPNECVELLRDEVSICVIGNHDWAALGRSGVDVNDFNPAAKHAILWTQDQLNENTRSYLDTLTDIPVCPTGYGQMLLTHASPREPVWEYILTPSVALENFARFQQEICLVGHTHKPVIYELTLQESLTSNNLPHAAPSANNPGKTSSEYRPSQFAGFARVNGYQVVAGSTIHLKTLQSRRLIINPGSVGQPRDHDTRAAYAILDLEKMTWRNERVPYPVDLTQSEMKLAKLPQRLIDRLSFGW